MREIKFRAWDDTEKSMLKTVAIYTHSMGTSVLVNYNHMKVDYALNRKIWRQDDYGLFYADSTDVIPMQFTGLKDKNGVEIYEGDIVKYNTGEVWVVVWSKRLASFIYQNKVNKNLSSHEQTMDMHGVEVIGNLYDNPDLTNNKTPSEDK